MNGLFKFNQKDKMTKGILNVTLFLIDYTLLETRNSETAKVEKRNWTRKRYAGKFRKSN